MSSEKLDEIFPSLESLGRLEILDTDILTNLLALDGNQGAFLDKLIELYETMTPSAIQSLIDALTSSPDKDISRLAHKAKGMVANLGANRLVAMLERIEHHIATMDAAERARYPEHLLREHQISVSSLAREWKTSKRSA